MQHSYMKLVQYDQGINIHSADYRPMRFPVFKG